MTQPITATNRQRSTLCQSRGWKLWKPSEATEWVAGKAGVRWSLLQHLHSRAWSQPAFSPAAEVPRALPAIWTARLLAGCRTSCCANCSWSAVEVRQEAQWNVGLSQAALAHTCRCLEKKNTGYSITQAGQWQGLDSQQTAGLACWPAADLADQGCYASSCFRRAALAVQRAGRVHWTALRAPGKAGWADLCCGGPQLLLGGSRAEGEQVSCPKHPAEWASAHWGADLAPSPDAGNSNKKNCFRKKEGNALWAVLIVVEWVCPTTETHSWQYVVGSKRKNSFPILMGNALAPTVLYSVPRHWFTHWQSSWGTLCTTLFMVLWWQQCLKLSKSNFYFMFFIFSTLSKVFIQVLHTITHFWRQKLC